jgi:glutathione S-transferase
MSAAMPLVIYLHPLSSYSQKAKTAFYEKNMGFEVKLLDGSEPITSEFSAKWPIKRFPILEHGGDFIFEATSIIEYIDALSPGDQPLIPKDAATAIKVRMWDRFFDNYLQYPQQRMVNAALGREVEPDDGYVRWRQALETAYGVLDAHMKGRQWWPARPSVSPIARPPRPCSMPTGRIRSPSISRMPAPIAPACSSARAMPAHSMKRAPTATSTRSGRRLTGIDWPVSYDTGQSIADDQTSPWLKPNSPSASAARTSSPNSMSLCGRPLRTMG